MAISVVRGFRTISAAAAAVLDGFRPFELQVLRYFQIYLHSRCLSNGVGPVGADFKDVKRYTAGLKVCVRKAMRRRT